MNIITKNNLDEATAAELQKFLEDKGIKELKMARTAAGWYVDATFIDASVLSGGPLSEMSDCMKYLIERLNEN